ncbi:MAG TPA: tetratricopeptide repeat protein [Stenomitos sp.]
MSGQDYKILSKNLVALIGVASTTVFFSVPALALSNSNSSRFDGSLKNFTFNTESTEGSRELLTQGTSGTGQTGTGGTGTGQTGTGGTGTGQTDTGGTGTGGTGTVQPGTGGTGTGGTGTGQTGTGGTGTGQTANFEQLMRAGYAATQQRDYSTALTYFQQALQLRPNNPYATRAVSNVQGYIQRDAQRGTTPTPTNQSGR